MRELSEKISRRRAFLRDCDEATRVIHEPIIDLHAVAGHLNPAGLGEAEMFSRGTGFGQSSVGFESVAAYRAADRTGVSPYGNSAEYAVVRTPEAAAVCDKFTRLHCRAEDIAHGAGAIICPSGLGAITTALMALPHSHILAPRDVYGPAVRFVEYCNREMDPGLPVKLSFYPPRATKEEVRALIGKACADGVPVSLLYMEAPGSRAFAIPDIAGIAGLAREFGIPAVIDNSWATHTRFKPLLPEAEGGIGADVVIQATTKYEGGYGDTPSGVVVAREPWLLRRLERAARVLGSGAVAPQTCRRLYHRVDSTAERMDRHHANGLELAHWFQRQDFIAQVLSPALETSPDHERFKRYFGKGNGLFTVVFHETVAAERVDTFIDSLNLFRVAESWGGHVSLALPVTLPQEADVRPGIAFRLHAGLESAGDLLRDCTQAAGMALASRLSAAPVLHPAQPGLIQAMRPYPQIRIPHRQP